MKTKEVVIEGWANVYEARNKEEIVYFHRTEKGVYESVGVIGANRIHHAVKCKLILEVPEKTVTISESDLAEAWNSFEWSVRAKDSYSYKKLKSHLFGEGE